MALFKSTLLALEPEQALADLDDLDLFDWTTRRVGRVADLPAARPPTASTRRFIIRRPREQAPWVSGGDTLPDPIVPAHDGQRVDGGDTIRCALPDFERCGRDGQGTLCDEPEETTAVRRPGPSRWPPGDGAHPRNRARSGRG